MKIKNISRDDEEHTRETSRDHYKQFFSKDPTIHTFEKPREYIRAYNSVKMNKIFAKPFVGALDGHSDTPTCLGIHPHSLMHLVSGSANGEIKIWDLNHKRVLWGIQNAHNGITSGIIIDPTSKDVSKGYFYSCSASDKTLKKWKLNINEIEGGKESKTPIQTHTSKYGLYCLDHHFKESSLVTGGENLDIWDSNRMIIKQSYESTNDSIQSVKYNQVEKSLIGYTSKDKGVHIFDERSGMNVKSFQMKRKSNSISWNPMKPNYFTIANEDMNCYTFDMRILEKGPTIMHTGHLNAVLSVDYSPSGLEFVSGSYDKTIRIFSATSSNYTSRDVYHTKRMQRVFAVKFSLDSKFVLSSSDDYIIRIWKAKASEPIRHMTRDEKEKLNYNENLIERYSSLPQIKRINRFQHLPKKLYQDKKKYQEEREGFERREDKDVRYRKKKGTKIEKPNAMKKNFKSVEY